MLSVSSWMPLFNCVLTFLINLYRYVLNMCRYITTSGVIIIRVLPTQFIHVFNNIHTINSNYFPKNTDLLVLSMKENCFMCEIRNKSLYLTLYVPCIIFQCVDKPTRCNTSYE